MDKRNRRFLPWALATAMIAALLLSCFLATAPKDRGGFSLEDYGAELENPGFQTNKTYSPVSDYRSAAREGKAAVQDRFENGGGHIFQWMGCDVRYDAQNGAYHIRTYPISLFPMFGGAYNVIIQKDGTVLAIWGEK